MEKLRAINRSLCRKYDSSKKIPQEILDKILWAFTRAPYASGGPRRHAVIIEDELVKEKLKEACFNQPYVKECSAVMIAYGRDITTTLKSGHPKYIHDCDAGIMCAMLEATNCGLDTCWIGHFLPDKIIDIFKTKELRPTVILLLGYKRE